MKTKIGGQAVLEGVMMRGESSMALSVRDENGVIRTETTRLGKKPWYRKIPFLRGIINLVVSLVDGTKIIGKSAEVYAEDELDDEGTGGLMFLSTLLGIALALVLFVFVPTKLTALIMSWANITEVTWARSLIEGGLKLLVLVGYMLSITLMKDIRRVFMYHGAEHKTIACFESGKDLTVENVRTCSRYHDRCGTSFIVHVVLLSVILMFCVEVICRSTGFDAIDKTWVRVLIKLAMLPLTASISYEVLMLLAKSNFFLFVPLKWIGKAVQRLTTREPDDSMIEVAICSFNKVLEMDADLTIPAEPFPNDVTVGAFREQAKKLPNYSVLCGKEFDWMLCSVLGKKQSELNDEMKLSFGKQLKIENMINRYAKGEPFGYVLGDSEFLGRTFKIDKRVLIPRNETELVTEEAIKRANKNSNVLDLCCGSGVIGISVALAKCCNVTLADVSKDALAVSKENAKRLKAKVKLCQSDMFENVKGKFDVICCNPPYIESAVIGTLDSSVKDYEPLLALDGGEDGLKFYRILSNEAEKYLMPNGCLVMEIGYNQGESVKALFGNFDVEVKKDYGGQDRIVIAKLK